MTECIVVPHTHWDREWYLPFERYRYALVRLVDELLDILEEEKGYTHFLLDAQAIHLEDYLEIRPEREERLRSEISAGRIGTGPWYSMPDEFLVSGEALVRNLLMGHQVANEMGAVMKVGYLPDPFGHISQMPQILKGFRIPYACFMRGIDWPQAEFYWEAPDGSRVLAHWFTIGYCNAYRISTDPQAPRCLHPQEIQKTVERLSQKATTGITLLMNGCDHLGPQRGIPETLADLSAQLGIEFIQGSLLDFFTRLEKENPQLTVYQGEMRVGKHHPILPGVLSSRVYLKQRNQHIQTLLEGYAEPTAALGWVLGQAYPQGFLRQAWKLLLQNHFHDAICASSVDQVHREMITRFDRAEQIAAEVIADCLHRLGQRLTRPGDEKLVLVFNPTSQVRNGKTEVWLETENNPFDPSQPMESGEIQPVKQIRLVDEDGREIPAQLGERALLAGDFLNRQALLEKARLSFVAQDIPPFGYRFFRLQEGSTTNRERGSLLKGERVLENEFFRIAFQEDGTLNVFDKQSGADYRSLGYFEDSSDSGDEYNYNPPQDQRILVTSGDPAEIMVLEEEPDWVTMRVRRSWHLPRGLTPDRRGRSEESLACEIVADVTLQRGVRRIEVRTCIENRAQDHRLRVVFPTGIDAAQFLAQSPFSLERRSVELPAGSDWVEAPSPTQPTSGFIAIEREGAGLAVCGKGLYEVEVTLQGEIYLTLLRAVGWLSRNDLRTRSRHAGPPYRTPEAQCLGRHVFEYAILPYAGRGHEVEAFLEAQRYHAPPIATALQGVQMMESQGQFLQVEPPEMIVSAIKLAEEGKSLIVRLYNLSEKPVQGKLIIGFGVNQVVEANLQEEEFQILQLQGSQVAFQARGKEIKTFKLIL